MNTAQSINPFSEKSEVLKGKSLKKPTKLNLSFSRDKLVSAILYVVSFLLPFFFLPITFDAFVLNKTYLIIISALLMLLVQAIVGLLKEDYKLNAIENYVGILGMLLAGILATVYSTNRDISLYGVVWNYDYALILLIGLSVLAFVVSNDNISLKKVLLALAGGATIASVFSTLLFLFLNVNILGLSGAYAGFNLVGNMTSFKLLELLSSTSFLYYLSTKQLRGNLSITLSIIGWILTSVVVLIFGDIVFDVLYLLVTLVVLIYAVKKTKTGKYVRTAIVPVFLILILMAGLTLIPTTRAALKINNPTPEPRLSMTEAWNVTASVIKALPLTGSGLGTFTTDVSMYKPLSINATSFWNNRFNSAPSDLLFVLSTMGIIGMLAYILFWVWLFRSVSRIDGRDGKFLIQLVSIILLVGSVFFGLNVVLWFITFVIAGLSIKKSVKKKIEFKTSMSIGFILLLSVVAFGLITYQATSVYKAQYHFRKAVVAKDYLDRYKEERLAIKAHPREAFYRQQNINTAMTVASILSKDDKGKDQVSKLVESAIFESRIITEVIDPNNASYWETRAFVYGKLIGLIKDVEPQVIGAATNATKLDPINPRIWLSLGNYYYAIGDKNNAANAFAQAVQLKNDYANAHYNLAQVLVDLKAYKDALVQLQITARLVVNSKSDLKSVNNSIDQLTKMIEDSKTKSESATVTSSIPVQTQIPESVMPIEGTHEALSEPGVGEEEFLAPGTELPNNVVNPSEQGTSEEVAPLTKPSISE